MNYEEESKVDFRHRTFEDVLDTDISRISEASQSKTIDKSRGRYPYSIVWTPIPGVTTALPFIGHVGICTRDGVIHDFSSSHPQGIGIDNFAFGTPSKYITLDPDDYSMELWDQAIEKVDNRYMNEHHNLVKNNCHSYVAQVLNQMRYKGKNDWNMLDIWWMTVFNSKQANSHYKIRMIGQTLVFILLVLFLIYGI